MAAYPSVGLRHSVQVINARRLDISAAGTVRGVDLSDDTVYRVSLEHPLVGATDQATLQDFYDTNKNNTITITLAGYNYSLEFESDYSKDPVSASYDNWSVTLVGNRV